MSTQSHAQPNARQAVVYIRVAAADANEHALALQRDICHQVARTYGTAIIREYADLGVSAFLDRQVQLQRLLRDLHVRRDAVYVVVWDYARLARDLAGLDDIIQRIHACGAEVATLTGVQAAERFTSTKLLDQVAAWANEAEHGPLYPLDLLRAALQGLVPGQTLSVVAVLPSCETIEGYVSGIGSQLGIRTADGRLIEDVEADWIINADVRPSQTAINQTKGGTHT